MFYAMKEKKLKKSKEDDEKLTSKRLNKIFRFKY